MNTLQILDGGESFLLPLDQRSLVLGSSLDADVRLTEADVAPAHARIEPIQSASGMRGYKLVDLDSPSGTVVNGERIAQVRLQVGDRIELGCAVVVVGRRVSRRATADDVLRSAPTSSRSRSADQTEERRKRLWAGALVVVTVAIACAYFLTRRETQPPGLAEVARLRQAGQFDAGRDVLAHLKTRWAGGDIHRSEIVEALERDLRATESAVVQLTTQLRADAGDSSWLSQRRSLDRVLADQRAPAAEREAAAILRRSLRTLRQSARLAGARLMAVEGTPAGAGAGASRAAPPHSPRSSTGEPGEPEETVVGSGASATPSAAVSSPTQGSSTPAAPIVVRELLAVAREYRDAGQFTTAFQVLDEGLASVAESTEVESLREALSDVRSASRASMGELIAEAVGQRTAGKLDVAIALLEARVDDFPVRGGLPGLAGRIQEWRTEQDGRWRARLGLTASTSIDRSTRGMLDAARQADRVGDWTTSRARLSEGVAAVQANQPALAEALRRRAADLADLCKFASAVQAGLVAAPEPPRIERMDGGSCLLHSVRDGVLEISELGERRTAQWTDVSVEEASRLADALDLAAETRLGLAVLAYRHGEVQTAERWLSELAKGERLLADAIQSVIRRGRGDGDEAGVYEWRSGRYLSAPEREAEQRAAVYRRRFTKALRRPVAVREALLDEMLAEGPEVTDAVVMAIRGHYDELVQRLARHRVRRGFRKLMVERDQLDTARDRALALIYDEDRYFYPYKPPAVSGQRAAEYRQVQAEVSELVNAVRDAWKGTTKLRVPRALIADRERLDWLAVTLRDFGERRVESESVAWLRALPAGVITLTVQNVCRDAAECERGVEWARIEDYNRKVSSKLPAAEREQVSITNAYRKLFGRSPLAVSPKLAQSARDHSTEMSELDYFGHYSPTPGRRTPFERMRLAGYSEGTGENCALRSSAQDAHNGWSNSSGHHRNLLNSRHREFGVGNRGRLWTQNFGRGAIYRSHPAYRGR